MYWIISLERFFFHSLSSIISVDFFSTFPWDVFFPAYDFSIRLHNKSIWLLKRPEQQPHPPKSMEWTFFDLNIPSTLRSRQRSLSTWFSMVKQNKQNTQKNRILLRAFDQTLKLHESYITVIWQEIQEEFNAQASKGFFHSGYLH